MSPGSSFTSTLEVALNKGYRLVCHTGNMIFVKEQYLRHLDIDQRFIREPELLFTYHLTWLRSWITWNPTDWLYRRPFRYNKILTLFCYWTIFKSKLIVRRFRVAKSHTQGHLL
jgi:hypothetical protein